MSKTIAKGKQKTNAALAATAPTASAAAAAASKSANSNFFTSSEILPYLSEEEKTNLHQEVLTALNNELVHSEDLEVSVPRLLSSCNAESKELRRSMNSIASSQIIGSQRALQTVKDCRKQLEELKNLFLKQGDLIQGFGADTASSRQLKQLHILRENVSSVIKWSLALKEVRYENLYRVVEERHFIPMYKRLKRLQKIRKTVIMKAGAQYRNYQAVFEPYFSKLDAVMSMFVEEIFSVLHEDAMEIAIQQALEDVPGEDDDGGAGGHEEEFSPFQAFKECIAVCNDEVKDPVLNFGSDGVYQESPISEKKIREAISANITKLWEEQVMIDVVDPFGQISVYLEQMKKVEPLLEALEITLIPLSTQFSLFGLVVEAVHAEVMHVISGYTDPEAEVESNGLIEASQFVQWYKEMLLNDNYEQYVDLSTIDDISASLMTSAVGGLASHLTRLCRACAVTVYNDPEGPTILPSGYPVTTGPIDMFTVLQQTLGGLSTSIELPVMRQIGKACADAIFAYLDECRQRSDYDFWEDANEELPKPAAPEEWQQRRLMLLYAFCNDCTTVENNLETIELKFASCWEFDDGENAEDVPTTPFQRVQDQLPENAFYYLDEIVAHVERVVGNQWELAFRPGKWYDDDANPIQLVLNTYHEFIEEEFTVMLPEQRFRKLAREMMIRYTVKYISTLLEFLADVIRNPKKNDVEDWNTFIDCVGRDTEIAAEMWQLHNPETRGQSIEMMKKALELCKDLLSVKKPVDFNFILQDKLLDNFADFPTFAIHFFIDSRTRELDKDTRDRMKSTWQERIAYQQRNKDDVPTTGWTGGKTFFGAIDPSIAELEKATRLFGKSAKKKRAELQKAQTATEKEKKRAERKARREADMAKGKVKGPSLPKAQNTQVEVASLADILKS